MSVFRAVGISGQLLAAAAETTDIMGVSDLDVAVFGGIRNL